jgi:hypothetical protein
MGLQVVIICNILQELVTTNASKSLARIVVTNAKCKQKSTHPYVKLSHAH